MEYLRKCHIQNIFQILAATDTEKVFIFNSTTTVASIAGTATTSTITSTLSSTTTANKLLMKAIQEIILKFQANDKVNSRANLDLENKEELKPEKVKRNLDEMDLNEDQKLVCQNFSAENDDILNNHFKVESLQYRTKHCSNYFSKFGKIFPEDMIPNEIVLNETNIFPVLAFVDRIGSMLELNIFESQFRT